jgi:hypothetical protein
MLTSDTTEHELVDLWACKIAPDHSEGIRSERCPKVSRQSFCLGTKNHRVLSRTRSLTSFVISAETVCHGGKR